MNKQMQTSKYQTGKESISPILLKEVINQLGQKKNLDGKDKWNTLLQVVILFNAITHTHTRI